MFVRFWNRLSCHDVLEKMTSECNLEIPTDRKFSGSAVNVLHALPNIFGCRRRRVNFVRIYPDASYNSEKGKEITKYSDDRALVIDQFSPATLPYIRVEKLLSPLFLVFSWLSYLIAEK